MRSSSKSTTTGASSFIDLDRTLRDIPVGENLTDELDLQRRISSAASRTWGDLSAEMRVVVLAEAGAGKTWEIRNLADHLRGEGKIAFFIRLELLAQHFELAFEPNRYAEFEAWLAGQDEGWLLLDSVDESRLRNPGDFDIAIRRFAAVLGAARARAHIVLTGRIGAWRPATDLTTCHEQLPHPNGLTIRVEETSGESTGAALTSKSEEIASNAFTYGYRLVALEDLNDEQIRRFAAARGVAEIAAFMEEVERADAMAFAGRPQDLDELVDFWREEQRIGSRWEILTASITRRLSERDQRRADAQPLAPDRAFSGARALAAAVTLIGVPVIRVPDGDQSAAGLAAADVLPTWTSAEINILLQRPVFDSAIYGTVRFHHRSAREFLAAQWFADRLAHASSRLGIEQLIFRRQYGMDVLSPMIRPVLPWLVLMDEGIRKRILALAPEVIFEGGDPSRLPPADQRRILSDVCQQMANDMSARSVQDYAAVQRFASPAIVDEIRSLLNRYADDDQVAPFLLRMVWLGRLRELAPEVIKLAADDMNLGFRRLTAIRALNAIGTPEEIDAVRRKIVTEAGDLDRRVVSELISGLPGTGADTDWLLSAIAKVAPKRKHEIDHLSHEVANYVERIERIDPALLEGFDALLGTAPMRADLYQQVSQRFEWVLSAASRAVSRLIDDRSAAVLTPAGHEVIRRVSVARGYRSDVLSFEKENLEEQVPTWPELNRAQFWHDVTRYRAKLAEADKGRLIDWWRPANFGVAWSFSSEDFDYVVEAITSRPLLDDRLVALSLAFHLYDRNGRRKPWLVRLEAAASEGELGERLQEMLHPPADPEMKKLRAEGRRLARRAKTRKDSEAQELARSRANLTKDLPKIREELGHHPERAGQLNAIRYLFDQIRDDHQNHWSSYDWRRLLPDFGEDLAHLFRDAARNAWRYGRPVLRSEGAPPNETAFATILGLAGLDIETRDNPSLLAQLTGDEVEIASRHAISELNGFPAWFPTLYEHHRTAVAAFLFAQIAWELRAAAGENRGTDVLSDVSWSGQWAWNDLAPMLLVLLGELEPVNQHGLSKALKIVRGAHVPDGAIAELARAKCVTVIDVARLGQWFAVWVGVEPDAAIASVSDRLAGLPPVAATDLAMHLAVGLFGSDRYEGPLARPGFIRPRPLRLLYELLHQYIRRAEDIQRAGSGVYSPGLRDHAQEARDSILNHLRDQSGKEALLALRAIATAQPGREWLAEIVRGKAEREGDIEPFAPHDVVYLGDHFERRPQSARQLGDLARLRLYQLKEAAEDKRSLDATVLDIADLTGVSQLVHTRFTTMAGNAFDVSSPPDAVGSLLLTGVGYAANQPVALATSEALTATDWIDALMQCNSSHRGVLAVVHMARSKLWRWPWTTSPTLEDAVGVARGQWQGREADAPMLDDVDVVGIDLTKTPARHHKKEWVDHVIDLLRWAWSTTLLRIGNFIIVASIGALTGILPSLIEIAIDQLWQRQIDITEPAWWTGWVLLPIGIAVAILGAMEKRRGQ
ncbi:MAG: hypothetical protein F9K19_15630 [Rhizobiaceae bacterium]|nr:MAG: hypothetical protein F9K19_15630 [Rhizobiaceae bacterium]CAG0978865.1 hypothetical protein RHIZO_01624 [Rhizobiaceae bacterium]